MSQSLVLRKLEEAKDIKDVKPTYGYKHQLLKSVLKHKKSWVVWNNDLKGHTKFFSSSQVATLNGFLCIERSFTGLKMW